MFARVPVIPWPAGFRVRTPYGHGMIWYQRCESDEADMMWGVMHDDGRMIEVPNYQMRGQVNYSIGRLEPEVPPQVKSGPLVKRKKR